MSRRDFLQASASAAGACLIPAQEGLGATPPGGETVAKISGGMRAVAGSAPANAEAEQMRDRFLSPPMDCRPHTRWWWMGNALTKEDITWQLDQMQQQGIGGVEQITMEPVYERGNHPYLSPEYFDLLLHAIAEAKKRNMEFSLNFGGPGWIWGGDWLPAQYRNQNLLASSMDLKGGQIFDGDLPVDAVLNPHDIPRSRPKILPGDRLVAVVAGQMVDGRLSLSSLTDLTSIARGRHLTWNPPLGPWRLMAFWLVDNSDQFVVDCVSKDAMQFYCDHLGGKFRAALGDEFGKTVESLFGDSFEVPNFRNGIYWNDGLLEEFKKRKGYDLVRFLPALWGDVDDLSPAIRYDVNQFLAQAGMETFFGTFLGWCHRNGVRGRIQPYGFVTDNLEGAGAADIPEMECTPGEKDAVPWFDTRIGPKMYVASGAHLYGRNVVSVEAYTFLHWQPGRATLEELKIASDMFLRSGANKFYNSGFTGTPEHEFVPSRRFGAEIIVSPVNVWWSYYHLLSDYVARCCALLRYGHPVADLAVYSPLANQWTLDVMNVRHWTRDFEWGDLGKLILANGYDFDLLNDDVLQNHADLSEGMIRVADLTFRILILPNIHALPLESMKHIQRFARDGGVVIALEQTPGAATGLADYREKSAEVLSIAAEMFREPVGVAGTGAHTYGRGQTYFIKKVIGRTDPLDRQSSVFDPFVNTLRRHVTPDCGVNFVQEALRENNGLAFMHRKLPDRDIYFVSNVQSQPVDWRVAFRVSGMAPEEWNPRNGEIMPLYEYEEQDGNTLLPVKLAPFESTIFVFAPGKAPHVSSSSFAQVLKVDSEGMDAIAAENGMHMVRPGGQQGDLTRQVTVDSIPGRYEIAGHWQLVLEGDGFPRTERTLSQLISWTDDPALKHFSGTGRYTIAFNLPAAYFQDLLQLRLCLGAIGNVADVEINGRKAGVIWMGGQTLDATSLVKPGKNIMRVLVTNTLINRVAGWKSIPPLPQDLKALYGGELQENAPQARELFGFEPLPRSGLLGPGHITPLKRVRVNWAGGAHLNQL